MARRRVSRQYVADLARISLSTLEKALAGRRPFTLATLVRLEDALGLKLRRSDGAAPPPPPPQGHAPDELGSYSRAAVAWIEGSYLTLLTLGPQGPAEGAAKAARALIAAYTD